MWQILLWCHMTTPKHYPLRKREFYKGQNWDINGRYLGSTRFMQLLWAYMAGLDWQTLEKYIHHSTEPVILDLWLACAPCQTIIIKCPCNVADLLHAGDNSASVVKHRPRKHSALLNGAWTSYSFEIKWKDTSSNYGYQHINWNIANDLQGNIDINLIKAFGCW